MRERRKKRERKKKEEEERRERTNECHGSNEMFRLMQQQQQQQQYDYSGKKVCKNLMLIDFIYIVNQGLLFVKYQISKMTLVQLLPIIAR